MYLSCDLLHGSNCVFVLIRMPKAAIQQGGFHLQIDLLKSLECFFNFGTSHPFPALNMYPKKQTFVQENHDTNPSKHQPSQRAWCLGFDGQCSSFFLWASRTNLRYRFKNLTAWCRKDQKQYRLKRFGQAHGYWAILKLTLREAKPIYIYMNINLQAIDHARAMALRKLNRGRALQWSVPDVIGLFWGQVAIGLLNLRKPETHWCEHTMYHEKLLFNSNALIMSFGDQLGHNALQVAK